MPECSHHSSLRIQSGLFILFADLNHTLLVSHKKNIHYCVCNNIAFTSGPSLSIINHRVSSQIWQIKIQLPDPNCKTIKYKIVK